MGAFLGSLPTSLPTIRLPDVQLPTLSMPDHPSSGALMPSVDLSGVYTWALAGFALSVAALLACLELCFRCCDGKASRTPSSFSSTALMGIPRLLASARGDDASFNEGGREYGWVSDRPTPGNRFIGLVEERGRSMV